MPTYLLSHALLADGWHDDVALTVENGAITKAQPNSPGKGLERIQGFALPGIPNGHSHAFQRGFAGLTEHKGPSEDNFWTWREAMYHFVHRLTPEQMEAIAAQCYLEMLKGGYTSVAEFHYLHHQPDGTPYADPAEMGKRILAAAEGTGIHCLLLPVLYAHGNFGGKPPTEGQRRFLRSADSYLESWDTLNSLSLRERGGVRALNDAPISPSPRLTQSPPPITHSLGLSVHSLRAVTPEMLAEVAAHAKDVPLHMHIAEQEKEVADCLAWCGQRPVEWLLSHVEVDARWCLVHATHMSEAETRALAASGAVACLCPTTEGNLGDGIFPAENYMKRGGAFTIGTDSHVTLDPAQELRMMEYAQRLVKRRRNILAENRQKSTGRTLLEKTLAGGAQAFGMNIGTLSAGARADLIVLDGEHPALLGKQGDRVLDSWIFAATRTPVRDVMVAGKWVVQNGHHAQEERVLQRFKEVMEELV